LTAWTGTLSDAANADHAVFALHEFRTDERPKDESVRNRDELNRFAEGVLGCDLPSRHTPWCAREPDVDGITAKLYVAHVLTDLRRERLTGP
jgi:hypothetical protein